MIDDVGLVNMNGRIYDPTIGRFMSADPFIQDVTASQNLNRYTYVNNNPLSYTDPSGFFFKKLFRAIKKVFKAVVRVIKQIAIQAVATVVAAVVAAPLLLSGNPLAIPVFFGVRGGVASALTTGRPKSFLGGFGEGFAYGLCGPCSTLAGGLRAEASGGRFSRGFLPAAVYALPIPEVDNFWLQGAVEAVRGGVSSVLGGGKFADGTATAGFQYLIGDGSLKLLQSNGENGSANYFENGKIDTAQANAGAIVVGGGLLILGGVIYLYDELIRPLFKTLSKALSKDNLRVIIYRAVGQRELAHLQATGNYGHSPHMGGKYFALTYLGVKNFANAPLNESMDLTITSTTIPKSVADSGHHFPDVGGAGPSIHFTDEQLPNVYRKMTPPIIHDEE